MIIVLIYSLCALSKFVYNKYRTKRLKTLYAAGKEDQIIPSSLQRYDAVMDVLLNSKTVRKVVDFGCARMRFVRFLKKLPEVEEILCVDVDEERLKQNSWKAKPLFGDLIIHRQIPLTIEVCEGSVVHPDRKLRNTDAVICMELIQHLNPDTLIDLPFNIFGYIKPKVVVITTPNADFNVLFSNFPGTRHPKHKFEWTRRQFRDWAKNIVARYPCYSVTFYGICYGHPGTKEVGAYTQMAVFNRVLLNSEEFPDDSEINELFKTVDFYKYPGKTDEDSEYQEIYDKAASCISWLANKNPNEPLSEVSLEKVRSLLPNEFHSQENLATILEKAGWTIEDRENRAVLINTDELVMWSEHDIDEDEWYFTYVE